MHLIKKNSALYFLLLPLKRRILLAKQQAVWRKRNSHNKTMVKNYFNIDKVRVGCRTYGDIEYYDFGNESASLTIGSYCSIAGNVKFLGGGEHPTNHTSTFPFSRHVYGRAGGEDTKGPIVVGDDVWICDSCIILSGVTIGQGAIIAANSIVTKDVPPYAIWIGNTVAKYRFNKEVREKLCKIAYNSINLNAFSDICDKEVTDYNVDDIVKRLHII